MRSVFLFGAGASHGAEGIWPAPPPLGANLLSDVIEVSDVARGIAEPFKHQFENGFEAGMAAMMQNRPLHLVSTLYCEIAKYLLKFRGGPDSTYVRILRQTLKRNSVHFTLNYDMLIEDAVSAYRARYLLPQLPFPEIKLGKLHGSANWIPDLGNTVFKNIVMENVGSIGNPPIRILAREAALKVLENPDQFMPDMCLYMYGKESLYTSTRTIALSRDWNKSLDDSEVVYICGVAINLQDEHIWNGILRNKDKLRYFGTEFDRGSFQANLAIPGEALPTFSPMGIVGLADHLENGES